MVTEILSLLEERNSLNDKNIREFCMERGLDHDCSRDYAYAAMTQCEYVRPPTLYEASLILKRQEEESPSNNSECCKTTGIMYNGKEEGGEDVSLYGFWKQLERAVKKGRSSVQRRGRHLIRNADAWHDDSGDIHVQAGTTLDRLQKEKDKGLDRLAKEAKLGIIQLLSDNLRRISENYDRCRESARIGTKGKNDPVYIDREKRCSEKAMYQTRNVLRPALAILDDDKPRRAIKNITEQKNYRAMRQQMKTLRDTAEQNFKETYNEYHRFFEWL